MKYLVLLALVSVGCLAYLVSSTDLGGLSLSSSDKTDEIGESEMDSGLTSASSQTEDGLNGDAESGSAPELVLMKFGAPWCPPCRAVDKELRSLGRTRLPVEIRKINVDERPALANRYKVSSIPRLILLQDGRKIGDLTGYQSAEELADWIKESASAEALAAKKRPSGPSIVHANPFFK